MGSEHAEQPQSLVLDNVTLALKASQNVRQRLKFFYVTMSSSVFCLGVLTFLMPFLMPSAWLQAWVTEVPFWARGQAFVTVCPWLLAVSAICLRPVDNSYVPQFGLLCINLVNGALYSSLVLQADVHQFSDPGGFRIAGFVLPWELTLRATDDGHAHPAALGVNGLAIVVYFTLTLLCLPATPLCASCLMPHRRQRLAHFWFSLRANLLFSGLFYLQRCLADAVTRGEVKPWHVVTCISYLSLPPCFCPRNRGVGMRWIAETLGGKDSAKELEAASISSLIYTNRNAADIYCDARDLFRGLPIACVSQNLMEDLMDNVGLADEATSAPDGHPESPHSCRTNRHGVKGPSAQEAMKYTWRLALGEMEAFISYSWCDSGADQYEAIAEWAKLRLDVDITSESTLQALGASHGAAQPMVWIDRACIDRSNINRSLACLPVFISGCKRLLVLAGEAFPTRLWCAMGKRKASPGRARARALAHNVRLIVTPSPLPDPTWIRSLPPTHAARALCVVDEARAALVVGWYKARSYSFSLSCPRCVSPWRVALACRLAELFVFIRMGGSKDDMDVKLLAAGDPEAMERIRRQLMRFDAGRAICTLIEDRHRLLAAIESSFGTPGPFNKLVRNLLSDALPATVVVTAA